MGFSRQEYWSVLPFSSPGDLSEPGIEPCSPALLYHLSYQGNPKVIILRCFYTNLGTNLQLNLLPSSFAWPPALCWVPAGSQDLSSNTLPLGRLRTWAHACVWKPNKQTFWKALQQVLRSFALGNYLHPKYNLFPTFKSFPNGLHP